MARDDYSMYSPEEVASNSMQRLKDMFVEGKEANEYMGTEGSISARQRQLTAQQLENCVKDKDNQPLVCYGCRFSTHGVDFPGTPSFGDSCSICKRTEMTQDTNNPIDPKIKIDRYIPDDLVDVIWKEWKEQMLPAVKNEVRQEVMDELAEEAQVMSFTKINRIILRKH